MAIHILTAATHPFSQCGLDLTTKKHSFMFGLVDPNMQNVCDLCKQKYLQLEHVDSRNCAILQSEDKNKL